MIRRTSLLSLLLLAFAVSAPACDNSEADAKAAEEAKKKADEKKAEDDALAKRKADREAKAKAKKDAEEAQQKAIDELCVLPEKLPKKLDKACEAAFEAQDGFMQRHYEGEALAKWNGAKSGQKQSSVAMCQKAGSIEAAACQTEALNNAPEELKKQLPDLLRTCMEKFPKKEE